MLSSLLAFSLAAALIVLLPGPDSLVVLRAVVRHGRARAGLTAAGVLCGLLVWVAAAALGLSALLRASETAYTVLRIVGAVYLVWLGVQSLRTRGAPVPEDRPTRRGLPGSGFGAGFTTDVLNPKVGVFFVTFLPGFVPAGYSVGTTSLLLGAVFVVETAVYFAVVLLLVGRISTWLSDERTRRRMDRTTGVVLLAFGARLATES
ncbi:LysE family translocator [Rhodococcus antarcticus]|uniref:LysE family translocator n=1 Tax=Rhodococcus antarcticus TaxID=2987751 RepID=A0ABY6NXJ2_9NOCA|nr:LysE family translocator [Rhodococcus antarcticus]UZJ24115.1 LysE family translocator [Rhodococcus antarcticus]